MIRTLNNAIRSLLFQAQLAPSYWVEVLHVAAHVTNIVPSSAISHKTPHALLFGQNPTYDHLRVFGCLCFPNVNYSNLHKLSHHSTPCLFIGYPSNHKGYRCLGLKTNIIIISGHVVFDKNTFPTAQKASSNTSSYQFLDISDSPSPLFTSILQGQPQSLPVLNTAPSASPHLAAPSQSSQVEPPPARMTTRGQLGIVKPRKIFTLIASSVSRIPTTYQKALIDPNWKPSMVEEFDAQIKNKTWGLVPRPYGANIINSVWLYKHKFDVDGVLKRHKSRLVANGKTQ